MFNENVKDIVKMTNDRKPDLIVFTGDLINKNYKLMYFKLFMIVL